MRYMIGDDLSNNFFHLLKKNEKKNLTTDIALFN